MKSSLRFLPLVLALACLGMGHKHATTVRFFAEANARDGEAFSVPIKLTSPPREIYIERVPSLSEMNIKGVYPFQANDGSWGSYFILDQKGRIDLEVLSTQRRGTAIVAFVGTAKGVHQVVDMVIDKPVTDGVIAIPRGLTEGEVKALSKEFPVIKGPETLRSRPR